MTARPGGDARADEWLAAGAAEPALVFLGAPTSALSLSLSRADTTPPAVRKALGRFPLWDAAHTADLAAIGALDCGDVDMSGPPLEARFRLAGAVREAASAHPGSALAICGGDNSVTYAGVTGLAWAHQVELSSGRVGLVTLDAHHDLRAPSPQPSNGSPVRELLDAGLRGDRVVQVGIAPFGNQRVLTEAAAAAGIHVYGAAEVRARGAAAVITEVLEHLDVDLLYLDVDFDVLDRAFAPACPSSLPGGLLPGDLLDAAFLCGADPRVAALDLVEVDAEADVAGITCRTVAAVLLSFAAGLTRRGAR